MNMLIGVLCEVVSAVANDEKEQSVIQLMKESLLVMLHHLDADGSGEIDKDELMQVMEEPLALKVLEELQVDVAHLMELKDMLFEESNASIKIQDFLELLLAYRGDNIATVKNIVDSHAFTRWNTRKVTEPVNELLAALVEKQSALEFKMQEEIARRAGTSSMSVAGPARAPG